MLIRAFSSGGLPADMIQMVRGGNAEAKMLAEDHRVAVVIFTGGREGGKAIAASAAGKKLIMELGGICASMVANDAELDRAADALVRGIASAAGQNCVHTQIVEADTAIFNGLANRLATGLSELRVGPQLDEESDMGPLVDTERAQHIERLIQSAVEAGAHILSGGNRQGAFVFPTLLTNVPPGHALVTEEVFGPVAILRSFGSPDEAFARLKKIGRMINASIFTQRLDLMLKFRQEIDAGTIIVNDSTDFRIDAMPFGGNGGCGLGREGIRYATEVMTEPQLVCLRP
jgi:glyceraldehyde-3-phosphate dehydrogenase (NADP+)